MAEYIEREELIKAFQCTGSVFVYGIDTIKAIVSRVRLQPAADEVEVVRCGNCKHFREPFCIRRDDGTHRERINMLTVDFCSYGERKDGAS